MTAAIPKICSPESPALLGDVGGTHCRLAWFDGADVHDVASYKTADYDRLEDVVSAYLARHPAHRMVLSFGMKRDQDGWYTLDGAYKNAAWRFSKDSVRAATGLDCFDVVHDGKAMGCALFCADKAFRTMHAGNGQTTDAPLSLIIAAGSGVAHTFVDSAARRVYDTYGAHMPPCVADETQAALLPIVQKLRGGDRSLIAEDILGGVGLLRLYQACCALLGKPAEIASVPGLLGDDAMARYTLGTWCRYLGVYANMLATTGYAYAGLYLCGGVVERLLAAGRFDTDEFLRGYHLNMVRIVDADLRATPVYVPANEHTALYGLMAIAAGVA